MKDKQLQTRARHWYIYVFGIRPYTNYTQIYGGGGVVGGVYDADAENICRFRDMSGRHCGTAHLSRRRLTDVC